jgi:PAS domain S-box-containing protein
VVRASYPSGASHAEPPPPAALALSGDAATLATIVALSPTAIAVLDGPEHRYALVNGPYRRLARGKGELIGRTLAEVWPEAGPGIVRVLDGVFERGEPFRAEEQSFHVVRDQGPETIWLTFSFVPVRGTAGAVERIVVMAEEVSGRVRAIEAATELEDRLELERRRLLHSVEFTSALSGALTPAEVARAVLEQGLPAFGASAGAVGLLVPGAEQEVELIDSAGYSQGLVAAWRRFQLSVRAPITDAIRSGEPVWVSSRAEATRRFPEWAPAVAERSDGAWAAVPLLVRGRAAGAVGLAFPEERTFDLEARALFQSLAERTAQALDRALAHEEARRSERALRDALDTLDIARRAAGLGIHAWDVATGVITWDARVRELWGIGPDELVTYDLFRAGIHPDDVAATQAAVDRAVDPAGDGVYRAEYRVRSRRTGQEFRVLATGQAFFADGKPVRLVGTVEDVTAERGLLEALRASEERFRVMADDTPVAIWVDDPRGRVEFVNREYCHFFGVTLEEVQRKGWQPLLHPEDQAAYMAEFLAALEDRAPFRARARVKDARGRWRWVESRGSPRFGPDGAFLGMAGSSPDVTERVEAEEAIREADRRKTEFIAVLSHELRNPLAPIRNALAVLDRATPGSEPARRARDVMQRQTAQLARLVDDLLDITRITRGKFELRQERLDPREVVRRACADARGGFEAKGVALHVHEDAAPLAVKADPARLSQLVGNLLDNALKFTSQGGRVDVSVAAREGSCELRVRDDGLGIEEADLERIFEPFVQVEGSRGRAGGGLGLGLALVRELARRQGGEARAASGGPGRGAEFTVTLPASREVPAPAPAAAEGAPSSGLRVLVVEDNEDAAATLADLIALGGNTVEVVDRGRAGVEAALAARADVLFCDLGLPDMTGHEVIRAIRASPAGRDLYAVALTGYAQPHDRAEALAAGFDAHLPKPSPPERIIDALEAAAARRGRP